MIGDLVEVEAKLAYTGSTSMNIVVDVRSGDMKGGGLHTTTECVIVFVSVDSHGRPLAVEPFKPESKEALELAAKVKAQLEASRGA